jgi:hypothetical protein
MGTCNTINECECDNELNYWPSERCSAYHPGSELEDGECCEPNAVDYYCGWLGQCSSDGAGCVCFDPDHRLASERCDIWHDSVVGLDDPLPSNQCPALIALQFPESSTSNSNGNSRMGKWWPYIIAAICLGSLCILGACMYVAYKFYSNTELERKEESFTLAPISFNNNLSKFDNYSMTEKVNNDANAALTFGDMAAEGNGFDGKSSELVVLNAYEDEVDVCFSSSYSRDEES